MNEKEGKNEMKRTKIKRKAQINVGDPHTNVM